MLWKWLGLDDGVHAQEEGLAEVERALDRMAPERARYIACFAWILTRGARADHEVTDGELRAMERLVAERGGLSAEDARLVVEIARVQAHRAGGHDDFHVTQTFGGLATREQKLVLLDCLFAVSSTDASIVTAEDNEIRRISRELRIEHADYIAVRARHLEHLEVLRRSKPG